MKIKTLKEWLSKLPNEADLKYVMDCFYGKVYLQAILDGKEVSATLKLDKKDVD